jgi:hypothetical protein
MSRPLTVADREAVVAFELAHLGQGERPPGSNRTDAGKWYGMDGNAWCAMFQSWSFHSVLGFSPMPATTSKGYAACVAGAQWFRRQGKWAAGDVTPKRGWLIFFIWTPGDIEHHIGLVLGANGPRDVSTVEGNTADKVQLHNRRGATIAGYGIIDYAAAAAEVRRAPVAPAGIPTLKTGVTGPRVAALQTALNYGARASLRVDGDFGPATRSVLVLFQRASRIVADGEYGSVSQINLQIACNKRG